MNLRSYSSAFGRKVIICGKNTSMIMTTITGRMNGSAAFIIFSSG